jgi:TM2 domain-containing membrane protein YozV
VLCFFFGVIGIHRFYIGKIGTGVVQILLTIFSFLVIPGVILGIWLIIDFIYILIGSMKDGAGLPITQW